MRVSDSRRVLFVHVPKCGGSTIDHIFDTEVPDGRRVPGRWRHATYGALLEAEPALADYWSIGFVRNPWARMVSWWAMMHRFRTRIDQGRPGPLERLHAHPDIWEPLREYGDTFDRFILEGMDAVPRFRRPQLDYLRLADGRAVSHIARTEDFAAETDLLRRRLGLDPVERHPRKNKTQHEHYSTFYTDATRAKVTAVYARDIAEFGYAFETV